MPKRSPKEWVDRTLNMISSLGERDKSLKKSMIAAWTQAKDNNLKWFLIHAMQLDELKESLGKRGGRLAPDLMFIAREEAKTIEAEGAGYKCSCEAVFAYEELLGLHQVRHRVDLRVEQSMELEKQLEVEAITRRKGGTVDLPVRMDEQGEEEELWKESLMVPPGWKISNSDKIQFQSPNMFVFPTAVDALQYMIQHSSDANDIQQMMTHLSSEGWEEKPNLPAGWRIKYSGNEEDEDKYLSPQMEIVDEISEVGSVNMVESLPTTKEKEMEVVDQILQADNINMANSTPPVKKKGTVRRGKDGNVVKIGEGGPLRLAPGIGTSNLEKMQKRKEELQKRLEDQKMNNKKREEELKIHLRSGEKSLGVEEEERGMVSNGEESAGVEKEGRKTKYKPQTSNIKRVTKDILRLQSRSTYFQEHPKAVALPKEASQVSFRRIMELPGEWKVRQVASKTGGGAGKHYLSPEGFVVKSRIALLECLRLEGELTRSQLGELARDVLRVTNMEKVNALFAEDEVGQLGSAVKGLAPPSPPGPAIEPNEIQKPKVWWGREGVNCEVCNGAVQKSHLKRHQRTRKCFDFSKPKPTLTSPKDLRNCPLCNKMIMFRNMARHKINWHK